MLTTSTGVFIITIIIIELLSLLAFSFSIITALAAFDEKYDVLMWRSGCMVIILTLIIALIALIALVILIF